MLAADHVVDGLAVHPREVEESEIDAALGNGGLGRLAACFLDSLATLHMPGFGYGINYEYGMFRQEIQNGAQRERPENWLTFGTPWQITRPSECVPVPIYGRIEHGRDRAGGYNPMWMDWRLMVGCPHDMPIVGYGGTTVNVLRLFTARSSDEFDIGIFNAGDYISAVQHKINTEAITKILYPSDSVDRGRELRLLQEYFLVACSVRDILRRYRLKHDSFDDFADKIAIQMNDTHPALTVAELMRTFIDELDLPWEQAWAIVVKTCGYTNHTLLPEALETWPVALLGRLLPRHLQIIYLINWLNLKELSKRGGFDPAVLASMSLIDEGGEKLVRMGHLAFLGSRKVNGVSALHTELMRRTVFRDLEASSPGKIVNVTNGISFRRWLLQANPRLAALLIDALGERVCDDAEVLAGLERFAGDASFVQRYADTRRQNKVALARRVRDLTGIVVDPSALYDVHIKRIHEYKRQLLNILEAVALFRAIRARPDGNWTPRVKIFAGKAAANYARAKLIIKLAHDVARVINSDASVGDRLKIVFLPNYSVSLAETIIPAADLSEQISTAGMEASGTGNMKLALNGALTIGTLDGANIEMLERLGPKSLFVFGLTAAEVDEKRRERFTGHDAALASPMLADAIAAIASGVFSPDEPDRFRTIADALMDYDHFMVAADFDAYWQTQRLIDALWNNPDAWWKASVHSTGRMGWFSSDRAIRAYAEEVWGVSADR